MVKDTVPAQAQANKTQDPAGRALKAPQPKRPTVSTSFSSSSSSSSPSSSGPQILSGASRPGPLTSSPTYSRKPSTPATSQARPISSTPSTPSRPRASPPKQTTATTTNTVRERQSRATQPTASSRQKTASVTSSATATATATAPQVAPRPSVRSNASTVRSSTSGTSGTSGTSAGSNSVRRGSSNGSIRTSRTSLKPPPVSTRGDTSRAYSSRPLPQIPQSPIQPTRPEQPSAHQPSRPPSNPPSSSQRPPRQTRPPAPLSARPLLPRRPAVPVQLASFSEHAARAIQNGEAIDIPLHVTANGTVEAAHKPRAFHMDGQTYDEAMAPFQKEQLQQLPKSDSNCGRIGPLTVKEGATQEEERRVDMAKYNTSQPARKQSPPTRPLPPQSMHRSSPPSPQRLVTPQPQKPRPTQHQRKNSLPQRPELWVPRVSSPLRQAQLSSPYQALPPPQPQLQTALETTLQPQPTSPRPNSADISPLTPPPRSLLRDSDVSPEKELDNELDSGLAKALRDAEEENGEPLLEWEIETIKASREARTRTPLASGGRSIFIRWETNPCANRAASESSSTALAFLLKSMNRMPAEVQKKQGIVSIGSVSHDLPQSSSAVVTVTTAPPAASVPASHAVLYEDDGSISGGSMSGDSSIGDYTSSWPESSYYFGSTTESIDNKPRQSARGSTQNARSSRSSSGDNNSLKRQPRVSKTAEAPRVYSQR